MDIHHDTSLRFILEGDSISSTSKVRICFCLGKGARLWLVIRPSIYSFRMAHFTFTSTFCFHFGLIQPSTSNFFHVWMWTRDGRIWHTLSLLPVWRLMDHHTWHHPKCYVCPHSRKWAQCMERMKVRPYIMSFITNWSLHDLRRPCLCCQCGGY